MKVAFIYMNIGSGVGKGAGYVYSSIPSEHQVDWFNCPNNIELRTKDNM